MSLDCGPWFAWPDRAPTGEPRFVPHDVSLSGYLSHFPTYAAPLGRLINWSDATKDVLSLILHFCPPRAAYQIPC